MNIGENIKKIRESKKISQEQLSNISGVPRTSLGRYERGERNPNIDTIKKISEALEVPTFMLTGEKELMNVMSLFTGVGGLGDNSKTEGMIKKLFATKLTPENIDLVMYNIDKDKINLAIALLNHNGYKATVTENKFVTIVDHNDIMIPFDVDMETFLDFSKNLHWAIDSFTNKFIDENSKGFVFDDKED